MIPFAFAEKSCEDQLPNSSVIYASVCTRLLGFALRLFMAREKRIWFSKFMYIAAIGMDELPELPAPAKGSLKMPITHMMARLTIRQAKSFKHCRTHKRWESLM